MAAGPPPNGSVSYDLRTARSSLIHSMVGARLLGDIAFSNTWDNTQSKYDRRGNWDISEVLFSIEHFCTSKLYTGPGALLLQLICF